MTTISIIESSKELRKSLQTLINLSNEFKCISVYESCANALKHLPDEKPDIILMDVELPCSLAGIDGVKFIKDKLPGTNIIILTAQEDDESIFQSLKSGAVGYLIKENALAEVLNGIKEVCNGGAPMSTKIARKVVESFKKQQPLKLLSNREKGILELLCLGKSYQAIADQLYIGKSTVKFHLRHIYKKLHAANKAEAIIKAKDERLV